LHTLTATAGDHKKPDYLKINPRGKVPTLSDDGVILYESLAILEHVEHYHKGKVQLLPDDKATRGAVLQRVHESNYLGEGFGGLFVLYLDPKNKEKKDFADIVKEKKAALVKELQFWEDLFKNSKSTFVVGETATLADVAVFPWIAITVRSGADLSKNYPNLDKYYQHYVKRDAVKATWPPHWVNSKGLGITSDL